MGDLHFHIQLHQSCTLTFPDVGWFQRPSFLLPRLLLPCHRIRPYSGLWLYLGCRRVLFCYSSQLIHFRGRFSLLGYFSLLCRYLAQSHHPLHRLRSLLSLTLFDDRAQLPHQLPPHSRHHFNWSHMCCHIPATFLL